MTITHTECPGSRMRTLDSAPQAREEDLEGARPSQLGQWPIQLHLLSPIAPYFENADLLISADCAPYAYANFHQELLKGKSIVIGCPKLDDISFYENKLTELFRQSKIRSVTVVTMEVPCCNGLYRITKEALQRSGKDIPMNQIIIDMKGERKQ